ncbi:outer membrane beta-barrel protein [Riemerella anatipestifer]|uniref:outer membrane beta-barrel protein n=1 Tax=Riemerella anatipestifer TaxID=34085 RepID=UPI0030BED028
MKKLLLSALVATVGFANAQKLETGFKIGYVNSTLHLEAMGQQYKPNAKSSVYIAMPVSYKVNKYVSLHGELGMAGLGAENLIMDNNERSRLHLTTVYIPLGVKFTPIESLGILGGFNLGFVTKALGKQNGQDVEFTDIRTGNHSIFFGGEYKITKSIFVETRYNIGLSNLYPTNDITMKNNFLQIGVGYLFDKF